MSLIPFTACLFYWDMSYSKIVIAIQSVLALYAVYPTGKYLSIIRQMANVNCIHMGTLESEGRFTRC